MKYFLLVLLLIGALPLASGAVYIIESGRPSGGGNVSSVNVSYGLLNVGDASDVILTVDNSTICTVDNGLCASGGGNSSWNESYANTLYYPLSSNPAGYLTSFTETDPLWSANESLVALLAGRSGGQTLIGGTASGNSLTLQSTSNVTKGKILFGTSAYDEVNNRLGIGDNTPTYTLEAKNANTTVAHFSGHSSGNQDRTRVLVGLTDTTSDSAVVGFYSRVFGPSLSYGYLGVVDQEEVIKWNDAAKVSLNTAFGSSTLTVGPPSGSLVGSIGVKSGNDISAGTNVGEITFTSGDTGLSAQVARIGAVAVNSITSSNNNIGLNFYTTNTADGSDLEKMRLDGFGNLLLGGTSIGTSAKAALHIFNGAAPTGSVVNGVILYAKDDASGSSELYVRDEDGVETCLSGCA